MSRPKNPQSRRQRAKAAGVPEATLRYRETVHPVAKCEAFDETYCETLVARSIPAKPDPCGDARMTTATKPPPKIETVYRPDNGQNWFWQVKAGDTVRSVDSGVPYPNSISLVPPPWAQAFLEQR